MNPKQHNETDPCAPLSLKILLVEDSRSDELLIRTRLPQDFDHQVIDTVPKTTFDCVNFVKENTGHIDVIISDIQLSNSREGGIEAAEKLAEKKETKYIPIVLMSGSKQLGFQALSRGIGNIFGFVSKSNKDDDFLDHLDAEITKSFYLAKRFEEADNIKEAKLIIMGIYSQRTGKHCSETQAHQSLTRLSVLSNTKLQEVAKSLIKLEKELEKITKEVDNASPKRK